MPLGLPASLWPLPRERRQAQPTLPQRWRGNGRRQGTAAAARGCGAEAALGRGAGALAKLSADGGQTRRRAVTGPWPHPQNGLKLRAARETSETLATETRAGLHSEAPRFVTLFKERVSRLAARFAKAVRQVLYPIPRRKFPPWFPRGLGTARGTDLPAKPVTCYRYHGIIPCSCVACLINLDLRLP